MTVSTDLPQILVIDDEMGPRESLRMLLKPDYQVHTADCVEAGIKLLKENQPDTIVMDIRMPGMSGLELQAKLNSERCKIPIIFITAHGDEKLRMQALRAGAVEFMAKPFDDEALLESVRVALEN